MTPKERTRRALLNQTIDRLPTQVNYTHRQGERLAAHFGVALADLPARLGNHLLRVDISQAPRFSADGSVQYDWWGAGFDVNEEGYFVRESPLSQAKALDAFAWPNPQAPDLLAGAERVIAADAGRHFVVPNFGWALFERAWSLAGLAKFFMDMVRDPGWSGELLDRITDIQLVLSRRFIALGVDGGYFGDDYGGQQTLMFSPRLWRTLIKPRLARLFAPFVAAGLPVIMHSDGNIAQILPDLVEIGLSCYNPVQPEVVDHTWLRQTFGDRLSYYGGVSTQSVMPFGSPLEVKAAVHACACALAPAGTGLLIAPSHRMMSDIPMTNVEALLEAFAELGDLP